MTIESIGTNAGTVYQALDAAPGRTLGMKGLRKATKLKKDEILPALGWLGREGKICLASEGEEITVTLA